MRYVTLSSPKQQDCDAIGQWLSEAATTSVLLSISPWLLTCYLAHIQSPASAERALLHFASALDKAPSPVARDAFLDCAFWYNMPTRSLVHNCFPERRPPRSVK